MKELIVAFILILIPILIALYLKNSSSSSSSSSTQQQQQRNTHKQQQSTTTSTHVQQHAQQQQNDNSKEHLIKSFKDLKYMKHCLIHHNGHIIVFCDDKRISLLYFPKLTSKHHKIISKNIDSDVISDISYSETTRQIAVSSKNGKSIYFYVISSESTKNKLIKHQNAIINTTRKYEIKNISIRKDGKYVITSGTDQDTEIQIYNTKTLKLVDKMETGGINNLEMKMNPNDNDIMISTFLNDISIIHFDKSEKFNNESKAYEVVEKITRYKSVPSKKDKILGFEFSNDDMFFVVACDKLIKIYQHYGNVSESKSFIEFNTTTTTGVVSLYVTSYVNGKLNGYVALSENDTDIVIVDVYGKEVLRFTHAHDDSVIKLKLVKADTSYVDDDKEDISNVDLCKCEFNDVKDEQGDIMLISAGKDGRIKVWNTKLN